MGRRPRGSAGMRTHGPEAATRPQRARCEGSVVPCERLALAMGGAKGHHRGL
jgi:hypothetical protein